MCTVLEALAIDKLPLEIAIRDTLGQHDIARCIIMLERPDRTDADDPAHAELLEPVEISSVRNFAREKLVAPGMAGEKDNLMPGQLSVDVGVGRGAEWRVQTYFFLRGESGKLVESAASDDSNRGRHTPALFRKWRAGAILIFAACKLH